MNETAYIFEAINELVSQNKRRTSVKELCDMAGVSRSGYYAWKKAEPEREKQEMRDRSDFEIILSAYKKDGYPSGARGICMAMQHMTPPVVMNLKKIRRLMAKYKLSCPIRKANPYRRMAKAMRTNNVAENLLKREFESYGPRTVLLTDITYLPYSGKFAYLSTILDAYTKQILSYTVSESLEVDFVLETVRRLVDTHGVSLRSETIVHSDQGCHYTSYRFIQILQSENLRRSMSRKGNCWDNAPQESFFGHMKDCIKDKLTSCGEYAEVKAIVDDYIDYYNNRRYQWDLAKLSPNEFYLFCTTGNYPLDVPDIPKIPLIEKSASILGTKEASAEKQNDGTITV